MTSGEQNPGERERSRDRPQSPQERPRFLGDAEPREAIDLWKSYSDLVAPEIQGSSPGRFADAEMVCGIFRLELQELALHEPETSAELIAEILRRRDGQFALYAGVASAILHVAAQHNDVALQLWEMLSELCPEEIDEAALEAFEYLQKLSQSSSMEGTETRGGSVDRIAMALFYVNHVSGTQLSE